MKHVTYDYSSIQVNLPDKLSKEIIAWGKKHIPNSEIFQDKVNPTFGRENEIHITVLYGLHSNSPEECRQILKDQKPFPITLGKIRVFHNSPFDVVVIGVESPELFKVNKHLRNKVKYTNKFNTYKPHVTIAYVKSGEGKKYAGETPFNNRKFTADSLLFSPTKGAKETIVLDEGVLTFKTFLDRFQIV